MNRKKRWAITEEQKAAVYNACRVAFNFGHDHGNDWHMLLHALREALCPQHSTFTLQERHFAEYPELREIQAELRKATGGE